jgi:hypothetical protein
MQTLVPSPTSQQPFVAGALLAPYIGRAVAGASACAPEVSAAPTTNIETALLAARDLCAQVKGSVPVIYIAKQDATAGLTSTRGNPLRPLPTDLRGADGKLLYMCLVH